MAETSVTLRPASESARAVPPVEISSTPRSMRPFAKSISPVLSETERRARAGFMSIMSLRELALLLGLRQGSGRCSRLMSRPDKGPVDAAAGTLAEPQNDLLGAARAG